MTVPKCFFFFFISLYANTQKRAVKKNLAFATSGALVKHILHCSVSVRLHLETKKFSSIKSEQNELVGKKKNRMAIAEMNP